MAINPMLLMMALNTAPQLMAALKGSLGNYSPNPVGTDTAIEEALNRGYDPGIMEQNFVNQAQSSGADLALHNLNNSLATDLNNSDFANTAQGFPSDFADNDDLINLADRTLNNPNIVDTPALTSAAAMYNNGLALGPSPVPSNTVSPGTPFLDSDLDDIHSNEMWEAGNQFNPKLRAWYLKNRR